MVRVFLLENLLDFKNNVLSLLPLLNYFLMETFAKFWSWLCSLPLWMRAVVLAMVAALLLIVSMSFTACGTPKTIATVQNVNPNSSVTVTMTVSNTNTTTPSVDTDIPLTK